MPADRRSVDNFHQVLGAAALEHHVPTTRGNQCTTGDNPVTVLRLPDLDLAQSIEALGKRGGEVFGHVLHDDDARTDPGQGGQHQLQGLGAARGRPNGDNVLGGARHCLGARRQYDVGRQPGGSAFAGRHHALHVGPRGGLDGPRQFIGTVGQKLAQVELWLGHNADRAGRQRLHGGGRTLFGQRGADDHGRGVFGHQLLEERDAIHPWHLHVQHNHIRPLLVHFVHGEHRVCRRADNLDSGVLPQGRRQHLTHHGGIINDQHFDKAHVARSP